MQMDAALLALYEFPAYLERQLLDLFARFERPGVACQFQEYIPRSFTEDITLSDFLKITDIWPETNKRRDELIRKKVGKTIADVERKELDQLQHLADMRQKLMAPLPLAELERVSKTLLGQR